MAVRIDNLLAPKPAARSATPTASKTDVSSPDAAQSTDFSAVLAKAAQPKQAAADPAPQKPHDASPPPVDSSSVEAPETEESPETAELVESPVATDVPELVANPKPIKPQSQTDPADSSLPQLLQTQDDPTVENNSPLLLPVEDETPDTDLPSNETPDDSTHAVKKEAPESTTPDPVQAQIAFATTAVPSSPLPQPVTSVTDPLPAADTPEPIHRNKPAGAPAAQPVQDTVSQFPIPPVTPGSSRDFVADNNPDLRPTSAPQAKSNDSAPTVAQQQAAALAQGDVSDQPIDIPDPSTPPAIQSRPIAKPVTDLIPSDTPDDQPAVEFQVQMPQKDGQTVAQSLPESASRFAELFHDLADDSTDSGRGVEKIVDKSLSSPDLAATGLWTDSTASKPVQAQHAQALPTPVPPQVRFAEDNHPQVVSAVKTQLLPSGGTIQLRLDPPDLGPLRLEVRMEDGAMSASFVTANEQATTLLTHTLGQLKHALEGAGINVDKLQVQQGSREQFSDTPDQRQQQGAMQDQSSARQEQQRREMLNRMWQKVAGGDPLDLVA